MRSILLKLLLFFVVVTVCAVSWGQQKQNAYTNINWPPLYGTGAPTLTCDSAHYGMGYLGHMDPSTNIYYQCSPNGWFPLQGVNGAIVTNPTTDQTVTQPVDSQGNQTALSVNSLRPLQAYPFYSYTCFGDSITYGLDADPRTEVAYCPLVAKSLGLYGSYSNQGVGAAQAADQLDQIYSTSVASTGNQLFTYHIFTNDMFQYGLCAGCQFHAKTFAEAGMAWLAIPTFDPAGTQLKYTMQNSGSSLGGCTLSGTWANSPYYGGSMGVYSTTNGSSVTCYTPRAASVMYLAAFMQDGNGGTFSCSVDGGGSTNYIAYSTPGVDNIETILGRNYATQLIRFTDLMPSTNHSVTCTVTSTTSAGNRVEFEWFAGNTPSNFQGGPQLYQAGPPRQYDQHIPDSTVQTYALLAQENVTELSSDGLKVAYTDVESALTPQTCVSPGTGGDFVHPLNCGHVQLAQAVLNEIATFNSPKGQTAIQGSAAGAPTPYHTVARWVGPFSQSYGSMYDDGMGHVGINWDGFGQNLEIMDADGNGPSMALLDSTTGAMAIGYMASNSKLVGGTSRTDLGIKSVNKFSLWNGANSSDCIGFNEVCMNPYDFYGANKNYLALSINSSGQQFFGYIGDDASINGGVKTDLAIKNPIGKVNINGNTELNLVAPSVSINNQPPCLGDGTGCWANPPATSSSPCTAGQRAYAAGFLYICVATNTWQRAVLSTF